MATTLRTPARCNAAALRRRRLPCSVDHGRLAGVEDHNRDAIFAQQGAELVSTDQVCSAGLGFKEQPTLRAFQTMAVRGNARAIAAMTIEMDNVIIARTGV
jgi:hypothetical protein